jgi:hypothetical protein
MLMRWLIILERRIFECGQLLRRYSSLSIAKNGKNGKCGIRWDCKEEPYKTVKQSLEDKLNACSGLGA